MTGIVPGALTLDARLRSAHAGEAAAAASAALAQSSLPAVARWAVPAGGRYRKVAPGALPPELAPERAVSAESAGVELADGSLGSVYRPWGEEAWVFTLDAVLPPGEAEALPRVAAACAEAARALLASGAATRVSVAWQGRGALCLPELPVVGMRTHVVSATEAEVAEAYEAPERFWRSGWKSVERVGGASLLTRAMEARDSAGFLRAVTLQQWTLARAARPGATRYGAPRVEEPEAEVYRAGEPALDLVGYDPAAQEVEYSCAFKAGRHVPGWQVFEVLSLLQARALDDGRPVQGVRVVFLYPDAAREEKRPLLDVGARVLCYDAQGLLVEVGE